MYELTLAANILSKTIYCCIATASKQGMPWNTPVFYSYDRDLNLYWASATNSVHSQNLSENSAAFIVIYDSNAPARTATAIYLQGKAELLENEQLDDIVIAHFKRVNEDSLFTGDYYRGISPERMYKFTTQKAWILGKPVDLHGHPVDTRKELSLHDLKEYLKKHAFFF